MSENTKRFMGLLLYPLSAGMIMAMNVLDQTALPASFTTWLGSLHFFGLDVSQVPWSALQGNEIFFTAHAFCLGLIFICLLFGDLDWFYLAIMVIANAVPNLLVWTDVITQAALSRIMPYVNVLYSNPEAALLFILVPIPLSLAMAFGGFNIFTPLVWWHRRSAMRKRKIRKYPEMHWDVKKMEGVSELQARILKQHGIKTIDDMFYANVKKLAKRTGIDAKQIWHWRDAAELVSIEGIDPVQAEILASAGMNCIYELSRTRTGKIARTYNRVARKLKFEEISKGTAKRWKDTARAIRKGKYIRNSSEPFEISETFECQSCGQNIEIKTRERPLHFRCPRCNKEVELR